MEFAVLGPLEVRADGQAIPLRRGRASALLAALLLNPGRVVPVDVLVEDVWGDQQLLNGANAVQGLVSYLRKALGLPASGAAPALRTAGAGYLLDVDPDGIDAHRFERLVASAAQRLGEAPAAVRLRDPAPADPAVALAEVALAELDEALSLWRGEPLQDVADEPFARAEIERLRERRAVAREYQIDAQLRLGRHAAVVPALRQLIALHPLRERLRAQLVLALYRCGRQADALREFDATRALLVDELGLEPGPELQRLQRAVLAHDPALDWVAPGSRAAAPAAAPGPPDLDRGAALPAPTTRLVGRDREIALVRAGLAEQRMVTLTGPGGAGKTRVALAVASADLERRPVWLVELAQVNDERVVPFEIARAVGANVRDDPLGAAAVAIGRRPGLLVLDTCEHLVDACAVAAHRLLRACPALDILATSRQPLGISGEVAWPVPPLGLPPEGASFAEVATSEAVRLFCERGRAARPSFRLDEGNADDVAAVCRVLDGLPLAIELAAARISVLSPARILARLDDRFTLLRQAGRAAEVRQRSLRAAIDWSHDLLDAEQQRFFARLGVFAGRFGLDAADAVAGAGLGTDPLDLLTAVVDRSLVVAAGDDSYRLLDSLRAYALDRLGDDPAERDAAQARLAGWLAEFCETREHELRGTDQDVALARLHAEVPNLRAALEWAFGAGDPMLGVRLACSLTWFWGWVGANEEAHRWLYRALQTPGLEDEPRARLLEGIAMHGFAVGDWEQGQRAAEQALELWTAAGTPERGAAALLYRGMAERRRGDLAAAAATHDQALAITTDRHDGWGRAVALYWRSATAADQHDDQLASALLHESLGLAERAGDRRAAGVIILALARLTLRADDAGPALDQARRALAIHEGLGWSDGIVMALDTLGRALAARGDTEEAVACQRRALRIARDHGQARIIPRALEGLAGALAPTDPEAAVEVLGAAHAVRTRRGGVISATQRRFVEEIEQCTRARLGAATFAVAFERGARRDLDHADDLLALDTGTPSSRQG